MSFELELLETTTGEDTTANDEATKELSEENTGVLSSTEGLLLLFIDSELVVAALLET